MTYLIDKVALEEALYHEAFETDTDMKRWDSGCWIRYKMVENALDNAPIIEERKTGKWIHTGVIGNPIRMGRCSECLEIVSWDSETGVSFEDYKFCPYCGAKMEVDA